MLCKLYVLKNDEEIQSRKQSEEDDIKDDLKVVSLLPRFVRHIVSDKTHFHDYKKVLLFVTLFFVVRKLLELT